MEIQVREREVNDQSMRIFGDAAIPNFHKAKDAFDHVKWVFDPSAHASLRSMNPPLTFGKDRSCARTSDG